MPKIAYRVVENIHPHGFRYQIQRVWLDGQGNIDFIDSTPTLLCGNTLEELSERMAGIGSALSQPVLPRRG